MKEDVKPFFILLREQERASVGKYERKGVV